MSPILDVAKMNMDELFSESLREFNIGTNVVDDGPVNAILYWFVFGDGSIAMSSRADDCYKNQAAEMLHLLTLKKGDYLNVRLHYMSCILKFTVDV